MTSGTNARQGDSVGLPVTFRLSPIMGIVAGRGYG